MLITFFPIFSLGIDNFVLSGQNSIKVMSKRIFFPFLKRFIWVAKNPDFLLLVLEGA